MSDSDTLLTPSIQASFAVREDDALALVRAAFLLLDSAAGPEGQPALDHNLALWRSIRTTAQDDASRMAAATRENLCNLAQHVATVTAAASQGQTEESKVMQLARINMRTAEVLLPGRDRRITGERAYQLWEMAGRPDGKAIEFWLQAEAEVIELLRPA
jgi:anti-sigma-K factor RskA